MQDGNDKLIMDIENAARVLRENGVAAIPTETVYGLAANAFSEEAVAEIFRLKGRPQDNPLIVHVAGAEALFDICASVPDKARRLAERFWPGPLTMVLFKSEKIPPRVTAGLLTVAVRCPSHPAAREIIKKAGVPLAAPSANISGKPSPTSYAHVFEDFGDKIIIVDGGQCQYGVESTVVDLTGSVVRVLRPGAVTEAEISDALNEPVEAAPQDVGDGEIPPSPGMKYRHYAPRAPLCLVIGRPDDTAAYIARKALPGDGVLCFDEYKDGFPDAEVISLGPENEPKEHARRLFSALRGFDKTGAKRIYAQCPPERGAGAAVKNRIKKAAGGDIIDIGKTVVLGLTGRSGSGKTTACSCFEERGAFVINADAVYRRLTETDEQLRLELSSRFGRVFSADKSLDRAALSKIVFSDKKALSDLNGIVHKYVVAEIKRMALSKKSELAPLIVIDAPQLFESGIDDYCDLVAAVVSDEENAISRLKKRDGSDEARLRARLQSQLSEEFFRKKCGIVIENNGTAEQLRDKVGALYERLVGNKGEAQ